MRLGDLSGAEIRLIRIYRNASSETRRVIDSVIDTVIDVMESNEKSKDTSLCDVVRFEDFKQGAEGK